MANAPPSVGEEFDRERIKKLLEKEQSLKELVDTHEAYDDAEKEKVAEIVNAEGLGQLRFLLLHQTLRKWINLESIKDLIALGANHLAKEINGDLPLHVAAYVDADNEIIKALLHVKYSQCVKSNGECCCGMKAIKIRNLNNQRPVDECISSRVKQILLSEELFHAVKKGEPLLNVHKIVEGKKPTDFTEDFASTFLETIIESEVLDTSKDYENDKRYLLIAMMYHFFTENHFSEFVKKARTEEKWKSYFMLHGLHCLHSMKQLKNVENFLLSWAGDDLELPRNIRTGPENEFDKPENEADRPENKVMKKKLKKFANNKEAVAYLIAVSVSRKNARLQDVTEALLKRYHRIHNENDEEECPIDWSGLALNEIQITNKMFSGISKAHTLDLSENELTRVPRLYDQVQNFYWIKHLNILKLQKNRISETGEIFGMECLQELRLDDNLIGRIPNKVKFSNSLRILNLSKNKLTSLPDSLGNSYITSLDISYNKFESLPKCVCKLGESLQTLNVTGNKGILEFPIELGSVGTDTDICCKEMEQLCYPPDIYGESKVLINHLRMKLYDSEVNESLNMMIVGPCNHGKTELLQHIFGIDGKGDKHRVQFCDPHKFRARELFWPYKFILNPIDFPGDIEHSSNLCFLTKNSLYLVVWNVKKKVDSLREWLNCLAIYAPGSFVMFICTHADLVTDDEGKKQPREITKESCIKKLLKLLESNEHFVKNLNFGRLLKLRKGREKKRIFLTRSKHDAAIPGPSTDAANSGSSTAAKNQNSLLVKPQFNLNDHWFQLISVNDNRPADIKRLRRKIEAVACDVLSSVEGNVANIRTNYRRKVLGDSYPKYYFHLRKVIEGKKKKGWKFLKPVQVKEPLLELRNQEAKFCGRKIEHELESRDLKEAVDFLINTGYMLHLDDKRAELYFIDLKWLNDEVLGKISNRPEDGVATGDTRSQKGVLSMEQIQRNLDSKNPKEKLEKQYIVPLIKSFNIGFFISNKNIQFAHCLKHVGEERFEKSMVIENGNVEKLCRLHVFENNHVPFGLWVKLLSRLFLYLDKLILLNTSAAYHSYQDTLTKPVRTIGNELKEKCRYWRSGFVYEDEERGIFFSVIKYEKNKITWLSRIEEFQETSIIKTEVITTDSEKGSKILVMLVNHINTMLEDFGLLGAFSSVFEYSPCAICLHRKFSPPYMFKLDKCFDVYHQSNFDPNVQMECPHHSLNLVGKLFPELLYADCPQLILSPCHHVEFGQDSKKIGAGASGTVKSGILRCHANSKQQGGINDPPEIAVKFQKDCFIDREKFFAFKKESKLLLDASDHPYIVTVYGVRLNLELPVEKKERVDTPLSSQSNREKRPKDTPTVETPRKGLALVMEHALERSLSEKLKELKKEGKHLDRILLYRVAYQIADAIAYMHHLNLYHRDIKPGNILLLSSKVTDDTNVKIADFDTASYASSRGLKFSGVGTVEYKGPGYYQGVGYESFVDIWAYGVVLFELLTISVPFRGLHPHAIRAHVKNGKTPLSLKNDDVKFRRDGVCMKKLMEHCWKNAGKRPKGKDLLFVLLDHCFQSLLYSYSYGSHVEDIRCLTKICEQRSENVAYITRQRIVDGDSGGGNMHHLVLHKICFGKHQTEWKEETDLMDGCLADQFQNVDDILYLDIIDQNSVLIFASENDGGCDGNNSNIKILQVKTVSNSIDRDNVDLVELQEINKSARSLTNSFYAQRVIKVQRNNDVIVVYYQDRNGKKGLRKYDQDNQNGSLKLRKSNWDMDSIEENITDFILTSYTGQDGAVSFLVTSCNQNIKVFTLEIRGRGFSPDPFAVDLKSQSYEDGFEFQISKGVIKALFTFQQEGRHFLVVTLTKQPRFVVIPWRVKDDGTVETSKALYVAVNDTTGCEVTSFCSIFDTLWFGCSNGRILVYTIVEENLTSGEIEGGFSGGIKRSMNRLRSMDPYAINAPVEMLLPVCNVTRPDHEPAMVLSYGKKLNEDAFYKNERSMCYPGEDGDEKLIFDRIFLEEKYDGTTTTAANDLILFWHAEPTERMERFTMERSEESLRNENLRLLDNHNAACPLCDNVMEFR